MTKRKSQGEFILPMDLDESASTEMKRSKSMDMVKGISNSIANLKESQFIDYQLSLHRQRLYDVSELIYERQLTVDERSYYREGLLILLQILLSLSERVRTDFQREEIYHIREGTVELLFKLGDSFCVNNNCL